MGYQDNISALLGTGQDPREQQLAQALRGQQAGGDMLGLSTIGSVSNLGQNINARTNAAAKQGGQLKQAMQAQQADQARIAEANTARIAAAELANQQRITAAGLLQDERKEARELALVNKREDTEAQNLEIRMRQGIAPNGAQARVSDPSPKQAALYNVYDELVGENKKPFAKPPSAAAAKEFEEPFNRSRALIGLMGSYKPEYANVQEVPWGGDVMRFAANKANILTNEQQEEAAAWWGNFDRLYTLEERNALFGGTLTGGEENSWERSNINANMNETQIKMAMDNMYKQAIAVGEQSVKLGAAKGYPEMWMLQNMEGVLDDPLGRKPKADEVPMDLPPGITQRNGGYFLPDGTQVYPTGATPPTDPWAIPTGRY